jgi:type I restriction enzyme S subunit
MSEIRWTLPPNWVWARAEEIADIVGGGTPSSKDESNFADIGIPWITPADLTGYEGAYISKGRRDLSDRGYASCGAQLLPEGAVLFSSRAPIGYCVVAGSDLSTSQGFKTLLLRGGMLPMFVRYYLLGAKDYAESLARGTTFLELSKARMGEIQIPVAPLSEQKRIIDKLDGLTGRIALARSELTRIPALLKQYRTLLLQSAYDGSLFGHRPSEHIALGECAFTLKYGTSRKSHENGAGMPILRIPNVSRGEIDLTELKYSELDEKEFEKLKLEVGDLLVVRSNGSPELVGRPAVVGENAAGMAYAGYLIRIRPNLDEAVPQFLAYMLQAPQLRMKIEAEARSTSGVHNINAQELSALPIPLFSIAAQAKIVERLDAAFRWLKRVEDENISADKHLTNLYTAVLAKAFRGGLATQNSNDESGTVLLEKIREERPRQVRTAPMIMKKEEAVTKDPQESLLLDSKGWPEAGLSFDEVGKRVSLAHDDMRDALFSLLSGKSPKLRQVFDKTDGCIRLQRIAT